MALDADDKRLLAIVLEVAQGDLQKVPYGLNTAMAKRDRSDHRNYRFVWRLLEEAAKRKIRAEKKRAETGKRPTLVLTP